MKKRIYRGVKVKNVDEERLADAVRGERVVCGLDVAKEAMVGSVWSCPGSVDTELLGW